MLKKLLTRTRDFVRKSARPLEHVSFEEWNMIVDKATEAQKFMDSEIHKLMEGDLNDAKELILTNRIHEEREVHVVTDLFQRIITIPQREKLDETVGKIKYIKGIFRDMQGFIDDKVGKEKMEADGKITIEREPHR